MRIAIRAGAERRESAQPYFLGLVPPLFCFGFFGVFAFLSIAVLRGDQSGRLPGHPVAHVDLPWERVAQGCGARAMMRR